MAVFISLEFVSSAGEGSIDFGDSLIWLSTGGEGGNSVGIGVVFATTVDCGLTTVVLVSGLSIECVTVSGGSVGAAAVGNLANRLAMVVGAAGGAWVNQLPMVKAKLHVNPLTTKIITSSG